MVVSVVDDAGNGVPDAVVQVVAADGTRLDPAGAERAVIDQTNEMFVPPVVVVRRGGSVVFHNGDRTQHHIYSFSAAKRFEFVQRPDDVTAPLVFDQAGIVAIGCNIHDNMVAHIFVTEAPRAAVTGAGGTVTMADLPPGRFTVSVWHARLRSRASPAVQTATISGPDAVLAFTVTVSPPRRRNPNGLY